MPRLEITSAVGVEHRFRTVAGSYLTRPLAGKDSHGAIVPFEAPLDVKRSPGCPGFVLSDAVAELARMSQYGAVEKARDRGAGVHQDEPDGPPYCGVGAIAGTEQVIATVYAKGRDHRAVEDDENAGAAQAGRRANEVERRIQHRLSRREHHRKVLRLAARHHGVGRHLPHGNLSTTLRQAAYDLVHRSPTNRQELLHSLHRGRHNGQAVRPTQSIALLDGLYGVVPLGLDQGT